MGRTMEHVAPEVKAQALTAVIGGNSVRVVPGSQEVFGASGDVVWAEPENEEQVSALLRLAHHEGWTVVPMGGGTQLHFGQPGGLPDIVLSMRNMNALLQYSPADMVVTVQPGIPLNVLQLALREHNQMLPLDPVIADDATVGGVIATAVSGPRRSLYGTVRDMAIGLRTVYPNGSIVVAGGKVVKNVAGYDMTKLFTGSFGTLAVLTEVTFKLRPLPMHRETVLITGERAKLDKMRSRAVSSHLIPSRFEALYGDYPGVAGIGAADWTLAVDCDENESSAARQTAELKRWSHEFGLQSEVIRGDEADEWWALYRRPLLGSATLLKVAGEPAKLTAVTEAMCSKLAGKGRIRVSCGVSTGVGRIGVDDVEPAALAAWIEEARRTFEGIRGNLVVERAPLAVRQRVDSFGSAGAVTGLLKGIKASIDPQGILSPGRFVGGI